MSVMEVTIKMDQMGETVAVELTTALERIVAVLTVAGELTVTVELAVAVGERVAVRLSVAVELSVGTERQLSGTDGGARTSTTAIRRNHNPKETCRRAEEWHGWRRADEHGRDRKQ